MDKEYNYRRIANVISQTSPDIVALQELDSVTVRNKGIHALGELEKLTGMHGTYAAAIPFQGGSYGIGILSREIPIKYKIIPMPGREEKRTLIIAEFKDYVFMSQDNNDGKLFVDIQDDGIKYCFLDSTSNTDNIMDAAAYMTWNHLNHIEPDWTKSKYITLEQKEKCRKNIITISEMAALMTKEEIEDFINYDYLGDMEQLPFF